MRILPVPAPTGTVAVIWVGAWTVNTDGELLKLTLVAPAKLTPIMVTIVPTFPLAGEKPEMTGVVLTVKFNALVAVPAGVVTLIGPVAAPAGTVVTSCVLELMVKLTASTTPNRIEVVLLNFVPTIVTLVPAGPPAGAKLVIAGGSLTVLG